MKGRLAVVLVVAVALSGCLGSPSGPTEPKPPGQATDRTDPQANRSQEPSEGNGTDGSDDGDRSNGTEGNGTAPDGNGTEGNGTYAPGWPDLSEARIRPGSQMRIQRGGDTFVCTIGFVFSSPDNRTLYVATASHCVGGRNVGETVDLHGIPDAGVVAYCSWGTIEGDGTSCPADDGDPRTDEPSNDFALVRIEDEHRDQVHPAVRRWGGPTAIAGDVQVRDRVLVTGDTWLREPVGAAGDPLGPTDPHEGYVVETGPWIFYAYFAPPNMGGDSGSPVLDADGRALGIYTHVIFARAPDPAFPASHGSVRLGPALRFMEDNAGLDVEMKTWPVLDAGMLPQP